MSFSFKPGFRVTKSVLSELNKRNQTIYEMRESGASWKQISAKMGLSEPRCKVLCRKHKNFIKELSPTSVKPQELSPASVKSQVLKSFLNDNWPMVLLANYIVLDGQQRCNLKINYPVLFLMLEKKDPYFQRSNGKAYVSLLMSQIKSDLLKLFNEHAPKDSLAVGWSRESASIVPSHFWNDTEVERLLFNCSLLRVKNMSNEQKVRIAKSLEAIPKLSFDKSVKSLCEKPEKRKDVFETRLIDLKNMVEIAKSDESLRREDYLMLLEEALACIDSVLSNPIAASFPMVPAVENVKKAIYVSKKVQKDFWPEPTFK
jgi:hypothetical protein